MFVYVAEFLDRPGLIKIGVSKNTKERMNTLRLCHGRSLNVKDFKIGDDCFTVEKLIHTKYKKSRVKIEEKCDGYTEFFDERVREDVEKLLNGIKESILPSPESRGAGYIFEIKAEAIKLNELMRFESSLSKSRQITYQEATDSHRRACERETLFIQKMIGYTRGNYTFGILNYLGLCSLNTARGLGVCIEHIINPTILHVQQLRGDTYPRLTDWKVKVLLAAVDGNTDRKNKSEDQARDKETCTESEEAYLDMISKGIDVTLDYVSRLPSHEERTGDNLSVDNERKIFNGSTFRVCRMAKLLKQRDDQVKYLNNISETEM